MGIFGDITDAFGVTSYGAAEDAARKSQQLMGKINLPDLSPVQLQQLVSAGTITPEQAKAAVIEKSAYADIKDDPSLRNAQIAALKQMQDISSQGGMTAIDKARLNDISNQISTEQRGQREAILQGPQRRGTLSGGATLMDQMLGQQAAQTRQANEGVNVAAEAQRRALEAISQSGAMGGNIRTQDFGEASQKAAAADAIAKFNAQNSLDTSKFNAQQTQNMNQYNADTANKQTLYNAGLGQQNFQNQVAKAGGQVTANKNMQDMYDQQSKNNLGLLTGAAKTFA